jgi:hypothetical protein
LDDLELFLFSDYFGAIRLLKQSENGSWYLFHEHKQPNLLTSFGHDKKTNKIFVGPKNLELEILINSAQ